ncbi:hypothetical protein K0M31_002292 [Melipona bicolor]|uniref:Uncharacterized protein n=1 Tax=Melipona bicolor TaxID=60889 RepID=A0AA40GHA9_9HYME|nr:hypothetical protein K0M31_002292 [Melipona bicolor]
MILYRFHTFEMSLSLQEGRCQIGAGRGNVRFFTDLNIHGATILSVTRAPRISPMNCTTMLYPYAIASVHSDCFLRIYVYVSISPPSSFGHSQLDTSA